MNVQDIEVTVETEYLAHQSQPQKKSFAFAYHITIHNAGQSDARLIRRHWVIIDGDGERKEVKGMGVVGEQPLISAGRSYQYSSGAVLGTIVGTMQGSYYMQDQTGKEFKVEIPVFSLAIPNAVN